MDGWMDGWTAYSHHVLTVIVVTALMSTCIQWRLMTDC